MDAKSPSLNPEEREALVRLRRDFHRHPELAFQEKRSAGVVAKELCGLGLRPVTGVADTGVVAMLGERDDGPTLLLRADMDALPVTEVEDREHRSINEGVMHACGHYGHMATLLAACSVLAREAGELRGRIKAIFQPAEEGFGGAEKMIAEGVLEDPRVDAAVALHYWSGLETGKVAVQAGPVLASVDEFHITVKGRGGHAALPHETADALVAAAAVVGALQTVVSRRSDPMQASVLTVGEFHAGTAFNIIAGDAKLTGTVRCFDREIWEAIPGQIEEVVAGVCSAHGCEHELDYRRINIPTVNDPAIAALVREVAVDLLGEENVEEYAALGGEDMADYLALVPGCFFFVGAGSEAKGIGAQHHHPAFDLDEDALPIGAELLVRVARRYLGAR